MKGMNTEVTFGPEVITIDDDDLPEALLITFKYQPFFV